MTCTSSRWFMKCGQILEIPPVAVDLVNGTINRDSVLDDDAVLPPEMPLVSPCRPLRSTAAVTGHHPLAPRASSPRPASPSARFDRVIAGRRQGHPGNGRYESVQSQRYWVCTLTLIDGSVSLTPHRLSNGRFGSICRRRAGMAMVHGHRPWRSRRSSMAIVDGTKYGEASLGRGARRGR